MACDSQTLESLTKVDGLASLSEYDALCCLASLYGTFAGSATAQVALANAKAQGMPSLSDRDLEESFLVTVCTP
jgi:hypothetical protein